MGLKKLTIAQVVPMVLIIGLSSLAVMLVVQNQQLRNRLEEFTQRGKLGETLKLGDQPSPLKLVTLQKDTIELDLKLRERPSILFFLSTTCRACGENIEAWKEIATRATAAGWDVLSVSIHDLDGTRQYVAANDLNFPVYVAIDTTVRDSYKIGLVPQTLVFNDSGMVQNQWSGVIDSTKRNQIITALTTKGR